LAACAATAIALGVVAPARAEETPLGFVGGAFGRFDLDTLTPVAPSLALPEPHARPVYSPDGKRVALGLSAAGPAGEGRIGVWIADPARVAVLHAVATGIAAESVVFPGVVAALLQDGRLVVIDPDSGRIERTRRVGFAHCAPEGLQAAGRGVVVNAIGRSSVELTIVEPRGALRRVRLPLAVAGGSCRKVGFAAGTNRVYVTGRDAVAELDPRTRAVTLHRGAGGTTAAVVRDGLAVAGPGGLRVLDTRTWRTRWRDPDARSVTASGDTVLATTRRGDAGTRIVARAARTGRLLWRADGGEFAAAAGRVYTQDATLDLASGEQVATHAPLYSGLRFAEER
jgi:hypothetical protein